MAKETGDPAWSVIIRMVRERAQFCCEYCQTGENVCAQMLHIEHIIPGAGDDPDNLCLACANCNLSKARATSAVDPIMGTTVSLFNPRKQKWREHFEWLDNGTRVSGKTPIGRATVERLKMNIERAVIARRVWVIAGVHPPFQT